MDLVEKNFFEWDVKNWSRSMGLWDKYIPQRKVRCLEIGARRGGLSLMLALRGHDVICSDLYSPEATAQELHKNFSYSGSISYQGVDLTQMPFENEFDIIIFKSVLGGVARNNDLNKAKEIARALEKALKPHGIILLAENNKGSWFHQFFRRVMRRWGKSWTYFSTEQMRDIFSNFELLELKTYGFFAPFGYGVLKNLFYSLDIFGDKYFPESAKYITVAAFKKK